MAQAARAGAEDKKEIAHKTIPAKNPPHRLCQRFTHKPIRKTQKNPILLRRNDRAQFSRIF
ncbi:hypothetical protein A11S_145 [Micavibrio aeruginosavorus EPB]|uniref:Uncharacterized protein n=1 Tax=Micavibrio aeruginosavorus EPB TaxID=349215 RepID=M4VC87_9BACT|nr:hypothetical protein A11S_145 [Micavibrio aeruginosavorus EPB]